MSEDAEAEVRGKLALDVARRSDALEVDLAQLCACRATSSCSSVRYRSGD